MYALRARLGDRVGGGNLPEKSPEHIYTALACALTGIIWLPVDMDSPPSRLNYLLTNSRANVVVSDSSIAGVQNLNIKRNFIDYN